MYVGVCVDGRGNGSASISLFIWLTYEAGVIKSETGVIFLQPLGADHATMSHMKGI